MMSAYLHQNSKSLSFEHPPLVKQTYEDNFVQECKISTIYFINFNKICLLMMPDGSFFFHGRFRLDTAFGNGYFFLEGSRRSVTVSGLGYHPAGINKRCLHDSTIN